MMENERKYRLFRRIASGTVYAKVNHNYEDIDVIFKDPSLEIMCEADYIYEKAIKEGKERDFISIEQSYELLKKEGTWSDAKDKRINELKKEMDGLRGKLNSLKFHKLQQKAAKERLKKKSNFNRTYQRKRQ